MQLDFGSLFFGETQRQVIAIFNNGPTEAKFDLSYGNVADMGPAEATGPLGGEGDGGEPYAGYLKVARIRVRTTAGVVVSMRSSRLRQEHATS